jgi:hypothetical protein
MFMVKERAVPIIQFILWLFFFIAQTATVWMTVLIAVNRFIVVCLPLRARTLCTLTRVRWQVAGVTAFSIVFNIPEVFAMKVVSLADYSGTITYYPGFTEFGHSYGYQYVYVTVLCQLVVFYLPALLLLVFNTSVIVGHRAASRRRRQMFNMSQSTTALDNQLAITRLMIVVVLVFFVCMALGVS